MADAKPPIRKRVEFDAETWHALQLRPRQHEVAAGAGRRGLPGCKHWRSVKLKEALRQSARRLPANDDAAPGKRKARKK